MCRYITRPALSDERIQLNAAGQVELKLQERAAEVAVAGECDVQTVQPRPNRISWARLLKRVFCSDITWVQVSLR